MCGIIGYIGKKDVQPVLLEGLRRMEYRGYDSAGIAVIEKKGVGVCKKAGKLSNLVRELEHQPLHGVVGIGHTRWATHGGPTDQNAHPHGDCEDTIYVIHNGIVENYLLLREALQKKGHTFKTQTDTEILAHLIEDGLKGEKVPLEQAVTAALSVVKGAYGLVVISSDEPEKIVAARLGSPLVLGATSDGEYIVASDVTAILKHTREVIYLEDGEIATITPKGYKIHTLDNQSRERATTTVEWDVEQAEKGGHPWFMFKEILEQAEVVENCLRGRLIVEEGLAHLGGLIEKQEQLSKIDNITIVACGSASYIAMIGEYMLEEYAGIPVEVEYASEFRYKKSILNERSAVIVISQSGETADTIAAFHEAKRKGVLVLGVVNVVGSTIARDVDAGVYTHAGPEIAVASTKALMAQLTVMALITLFLGRQRGMSLVTGKRIAEELQAIPGKIRSVLAKRSEIEALAKKYYQSKDFYYLGRKYEFPIALEGALKLKEIAYIHAEGYMSAEMKHGPLALIEENFPAWFLAPDDSVLEKNINSIQEIKARGGKVLAVATEGDTVVPSMAHEVFFVPKTLEMLTPLLTVIPMQLFAYYCALLRGNDIDQPRNLAKSVTVE